MFNSKDSITKNEEINKPNNIDYYLNNKIGYFTQAKTKENEIYISRLVAKFYIKSLTKKEFTKLVLDLIPDYDDELLFNERENFILMAKQYDTWQNIQSTKDLFPYLKYSAIVEISCPVCKKLDNVIRHADDPFWDIYYPPNCPECRCIVQQYEKNEINKPTDLTKIKLKLPIEEFAINVGKHELKSLY